MICVYCSGRESEKDRHVPTVLYRIIVMSSSVSVCYLSSFAVSIVCACVLVCVRGCLAVLEPELQAVCFEGVL